MVKTSWRDKGKRLSVAYSPPKQERRQSSSQQRRRTLNWGEEIRFKGRPFPIPRLSRYGCRAYRDNVSVRLTGASDKRGGKGDG